MAIQEVKLVSEPIVRERPTIECGPGRTKQEFKKDTDVNVIIKTFERTGTIKFRDENEAMYGDIPSGDFHAAMNIVARSKEMFDALPANIRKRFGYDPAAFMEFVQNPENEDEARKMGLLSPDRSHDSDVDGVPDVDDPAPDDPDVS